MFKCPVKSDNNRLLTEIGYYVTFWNQKLSCGTLFLHKSDEILQACSLKHSIKKDMFSVLGKMNTFRSERGPPSVPPFPWLRAWNIHKLLILLSSHKNIIIIIFNIFWSTALFIFSHLQVYSFPFNRFFLVHFMNKNR